MGGPGVQREGSAERGDSGKNASMAESGEVGAGKACGLGIDQRSQQGGEEAWALGLRLTYRPSTALHYPIRGHLPCAAALRGKTIPAAAPFAAMTLPPRALKILLHFAKFHFDFPRLQILIAEFSGARFVHSAYRSPAASTSGKHQEPAPASGNHQLSPPGTRFVLTLPTARSLACCRFVFTAFSRLREN